MLSLTISATADIEKLKPNRGACSGECNSTEMMQIHVCMVSIDHALRSASIYRSTAVPFHVMHMMRAWPKGYSRAAGRLSGLHASVQLAAAVECAAVRTPGAAEVTGPGSSQM